VHLQTVLSNTMRLYCRTSVDAFAYTYDLTTAKNGGEGVLTIAYNSQLAVANDVDFNGDSLDLIGQISAAANATISATIVNATSPASGPGVFVSGNLVLNAPSASYSNTFFSVFGDVTVGGGTAGQQQFASGQINLNGNFNQLPGAVPNTFVTSFDHQVTLQGFNGTGTVSMANAAANPFTNLVIDRFGGTTTFNSDVTLAVTPRSTAPITFALISGKLTVPTSRLFTVNGVLALLNGTTFTVDGAAVTPGGSCQRNPQGGTAVVNGTGTVNGQTPSVACP